MRSIKSLSAASLALLLFITGSIYAQETDENTGDEGELTITLIPDPQADLPEAVTKQISLPLPNASDAGNEHSADGRAIADDRLERRQAGLDMAADAQENRENFSRGNAPDLPELPDLPPNLPDGPTPPNPPGPPGP